MSGSVTGNIFTVSTWGESHGKALGVVVDGCPAGLPLEESDIQEMLDRRKPGQSKFTTARKEGDEVQILSGVFEGKTTGTPISMLVWNKDQRSKDYGQIAYSYRPGHADFTFEQKYGFRDYRGGGRSSGRETVGRVAAGAVAIKILKELGIEIYAYAKSIGPISIDYTRFDKNEISNNKMYMPDAEAAGKAEEYLHQKIQEQDSSGGVIECVIKNMPVGVGNTVFDKLDANLAKAIMSIGAVKGFEIGDGFAAAESVGSVNNDSFYINEEGNISKKTNHAGGILGGMSDGSDIIFRAAVKPTPSISREQQTVTNRGEEINMVIHGRHDPIIVPRAVVVVESMAAITIVDLLFSGMSARMDSVKKIYEKTQQ
ncbi:MAG: chorismate synthase [Lachnospiraceae bacterium]|nr:chorismate synthase [Lachnospiraceae bacterium]